MYTLLTFRNCITIEHFVDAGVMAQNLLESIKAEGFDLSHQWVKIDDGFGRTKVLYPHGDGTTAVSPWFSNF